ncbi:T cell activation RhoGTPase activating protein b isoform X2 [Astyanax mexicanus]|uniref:T cell activation RhoGTPase activating protein b isoform X2 n=1 Tax=Astyanax mexicanus TaxID=7994 RepID=UPI0020CAB097|nr:T cell activation RhoGTPase activating protein b isoform X2 [Astyanax mexicanus]
MRRGSYDDVTAPIRPHMRSLAQRRRSAPTLVFGKALGMSWSPIREESPYPMTVEQSPFVLGLSTEDSELLLDDTVQLTEGLKTRERHLFLLTDVLVIAKLKSCASYRLKHRVDLKDLWVCALKSEDDEVEDEDGEIDVKTTILLVWSVSLCLVSFSSPEVKERWLDTLHRKAREARQKAGCCSPPHSVLMKVLSSTITNKTLTGGGMDSVIELSLQGNGISALQKELCKQEPQPEQSMDHEGSTGSKKSIFPFRLKRSSTVSGLPTRSEKRKSLLFGQPLSRDAPLPKPITDVLVLLCRKGPSTEGVFRTTCNSRNLNAVREQLDSGTEVDMEALPVTLLVGLLKTFLKELPGSLLVADHYDKWVEALEKEEMEEKCHEMRKMVEKLPEANGLLLQYVLCLLHHIAQRSKSNKMDTKNLAVCIAPTLLQDSSQMMEVNKVEKVTNLTQFLIENCCKILGEKILSLLRDPEEEELGDNSDSMSSHQHDSAYDSTDPDGDGDSAEALGPQEDEKGALGNCQIRIECTHVASCSSDAIFETFTKPFNRRCSEPSILSSAAIKNLRGLARSQDDCSCPREEYTDQPLKKQVSDDSFLHPQCCYRSLTRKLAGSLNMDAAVSVSAPISKACSCSSSFSLESAASNVSETSVFMVATSPLPSPASPRKSQTTSKPRAEAVKADLDVRRHSSPFKRAKSLGNFSTTRGSTKKVDCQKDTAFSCETLQEDSQNETEAPDEPMRRQRPLSAIEVFQHVDSRTPSGLPTYEQAVLSGALPAPPQYRKMTVYEAIEQGRKSRPMSMNDYILDSTPASQFMDSIAHSIDNNVGQQGSFRQRAMSESVARTKFEKVSRRCSQPVFEEFSYAKESYV